MKKCVLNKWIYLVLFGLLVFAALTACLKVLHDSPRVGASFGWSSHQSRWIVDSGKKWSLLRDGDLVLAIEGRDVRFLDLLTDNIFITSRPELFDWFEKKRELHEILRSPGLGMTVQREGAVQSIRTPLRVQGLSFFLKWDSVHFLVALAFFFIGMIVLYKKGVEQISMVFFLFCMSAAVMLITFAAGLLAELAFEPSAFATVNIINLITFYLSSVLLLHFSLLVPVKRGVIARHPRLLWLLYAASAVIIGSLHLKVMYTTMVLYCMGALAAVIHGFIRYAGPVERQQMKWVASGFVFGLGPWMLMNGIPLLITGENHLSYSVSAIFLVLVPLFMAFAIHKYRLFDIPAFFEGAFVYALTFAVLVVVDIAVMSFLGTHFAESLGVHPTGRTLLPLILALPLYMAVRDVVRYAVRKTVKATISGNNDHPAGKDAAVSASGPAYMPERESAEPSVNGRYMLSAREREILGAVEQGLKYKEVAERLNISPHTVHTHMKNIYEKLQVKNRQEALTRARKIGAL